MGTTQKFHIAVTDYFRLFQCTEKEGKDPL